MPSKQFETFAKQFSSTTLEELRAYLSSLDHSLQTILLKESITLQSIEGTQLLVSNGVYTNADCGERNEILSAATNTGNIALVNIFLHRDIQRLVGQGSFIMGDFIGSLLRADRDVDAKTIFNAIDDKASLVKSIQGGACRAAAKEGEAGLVRKLVNDFAVPVNYFTLSYLCDAGNAALAIELINDETKVKDFDGVRLSIYGLDLSLKLLSGDQNEAAAVAAKSVYNTIQQSSRYSGKINHHIKAAATDVNEWRVRKLIEDLNASIDPHTMKILIKLPLTLLQQGQIAEAQTFYDFIRARNPDAVLAIGSSLKDAIRQGDYDLVEQLLNIGGPVDFKDTSGNTLLHDAIISYNFDVAAILLRHGADVETITNGVGLTAEYLAVCLGMDVIRQCQPEEYVPPELPSGHSPTIIKPNIPAKLSLLAAEALIKAEGVIDGYDSIVCSRLLEKEIYDVVRMVMLVREVDIDASKAQVIIELAAEDNKILIDAIGLSLEFFDPADAV